MKNFYKTITVFLLAVFSVVLTNPVYAESNENNNVKVVAETEQDDEIEYYDYHSGITYSYSIFDYARRHLDKHAVEQDKKSTESKAY